MRYEVLRCLDKKSLQKWSIETHQYSPKARGYLEYEFFITIRPSRVNISFGCSVPFCVDLASTVHTCQIFKHCKSEKYSRKW